MRDDVNSGEMRDRGQDRRGVEDSENEKLNDEFFLEKG